MYGIGTLRKFGEWELVLVDRASGEQAYVNTRTGESRKDPPDEVQGILIKESRAPVYDPTPHRFLDLMRSSHNRCEGDGHSLEDGVRSAPVERVDLWSAGADSAFLLRNLLSSSECDDIIEQAERFGMQDTGYNHKIRVNDRVAIMGEDLGDLLFERARPFLKDVDVPEDQKQPEGAPAGILKGLWQPTGLNPCFRVCKYSPGGFFRPHHDAGFYVTDTHQSIKTFMIYLNDGFEGGPTNFYNRSQPHYKPGVPEHVVHSLRPEKGSCLVFNHFITHDGGELATGNKYILRTEVMYQRVTSFFSGGVGNNSGESSDSDFEPHEYDCETSNIEP